jgi:hypothetical protein
VSDLEPAFPRCRSGVEKNRIVDTDSGDEVKELCYCRRTMAIVVKPLMCCDVGVVRQTCLEVLSLHASTSLSKSWLAWSKVSGAGEWCRLPKSSCFIKGRE